MVHIIYLKEKEKEKENENEILLLWNLDY